MVDIEQVAKHSTENHPVVYRLKKLIAEALAAGCEQLDAFPDGEQAAAMKGVEKLLRLLAGLRGIELQNEMPWKGDPVKGQAATAGDEHVQHREADGNALLRLEDPVQVAVVRLVVCLLYTSPSPRD